MTEPSLAVTRRALHAVAELVMAGPQHRRTGEIKLFVCPGGFRTATEPDLRVEGGDLVAGDLRLPIGGRSADDLARAAGVDDAGAPRDLYHDGSGVKPDEPLALDPAAARWLEACWTAGDLALRRVAPDQQPILWPEHFDVGVLDGDIAYGVSPGDTFFPEPYAYVTPPTPRSGRSGTPRSAWPASCATSTRPTPTLSLPSSPKPAPASPTRR